MNQPITHQDWWGLNQIQGSKDVGIEIRGTHAINIKRHFKITNYKKALSVNKRSWGTLSLARGSLYFLTRAQTGCVPVSRSLSRILGKQMSNNWPRSAGHQSVGARALHLAMIESCLNLNFQFSSVSGWILRGFSCIELWTQQETQYLPTNFMNVLCSASSKQK